MSETCDLLSVIESLVEQQLLAWQIEPKLNVLSVTTTDAGRTWLQLHHSSRLGRIVSMLKRQNTRSDQGPVKAILRTGLNRGPWRLIILDDGPAFVDLSQKSLRS